MIWRVRVCFLVLGEVGFRWPAAGFKCIEVEALLPGWGSRLLSSESWNHSSGGVWGVVRLQVGRSGARTALSDEKGI